MAWGVGQNESDFPKRRGFQEAVGSDLPLSSLTNWFFVWMQLFVS